MNAPVLIMAGGTGGHVFPALAVAEELRRRQHPVVWLGTGRGLEARLVPAAGFAFEQLRVQGLRRRGALAWLVAPFTLVLALLDALRVIRRCRPRLVLGMGGYASGPGGLAAWLLRLPLVIHEQNAVAGLTNRLLARFAREVLQAFPGSFSPRIGARTVGNPVRPDISALPAPESRLADRQGPLRLLVLGGSQGARAINLVVPAAVAALPAGRRPIVRHQSGSLTLQETLAAWRAVGVEARVEPFIENMAEAYGWADLVIARSGALTIAELCAAGLPALLVPYPTAVDDHQTRNAGALVAAGAAELLPQADLTAGRLSARLEALLSDREELRRRAFAARELARPDATAAITDACLAAGGGR
ncbi:MAG: undecaprenyldiphospho-muramoylpentapeptide beta-N-acetylglucosaminyltransferase [Chromatiales bacterium]|nr:undecaprenyldiphospho-muramoylpentapeptide beta-N-acetylglucosaminyltransferase [Chromatiales bacterium]